ncbi:hypothetical protein B0O99DRAFT_691787 [Bisporella sp. PMI_857]|nr:hypothetical protein B0O99DRAFT_691787 [Bisporella sp. PMI_857]
MPPANPRKRQAPGSPVLHGPPAHQTYPTMPNADYMMWAQAPDNKGFTDQTAFNNMNNNYNGVAISQSGYDSTPTTSTQLARRPMNRQLVQTTQRTPYDQSVESWGQFGDDMVVDAQNQAAPLEETDNIELLEEKAAVAKREAQAKRKQIPPFVQKLSSFLDDGKNTDLIRWSDRGDSFVVLDEDEFAKTLIPELFKHNNYASFVRQLNMYGFHKRVGLSDNSMKASERKNKSPSEYYNPFFKRGHPNLLWLINKPKGGTGKGPRATNKDKHVKEEQQNGRESDDEGDVEDINPYYPNNPPSTSRAISAVPESGPLQKREMALVHKEIADIQKQQSNILQAINRLRKEHNQLFQQAMAFQSLHDRHESSINAILTFLATVYNRSLDGQGGVPPDIANMFANGIPSGQPQQQGSVVDMGDIQNRQSQPSGNVSPYRRQQRLLMPPQSNQAQTVSNTSTPQSRNPQTPQNGAVEELFDTSPADSSQIKVENDIPQQDMMDLINNTNAMAGSDHKGMEFDQVLSHYENANGNSPLTPQQRDTMLNMIANQTSAPGTNNALVSPTPPPVPSLDQFQMSNDELDKILGMQREQDYKIDGLKRAVTPLSPSGSIPGLNGDSYFNGDLSSNIDASHLDLDQYIDSGAFYNGSSPGPNADYAFNYGDQGLGESHFDLGMDGTNDRIIETPDTPENDIEEVDRKSVNGGIRSPSKRRRKN